MFGDLLLFQMFLGLIGLFCLLMTVLVYHGFFFLLKQKSNVSSTFQRLFHMIKNQFGVERNEGSIK